MSLENDFSKFLLLNCKEIMRNRINIQTIIRLLIDKGIFTEEEFRQKQRYVGSQKMYIDQIDYIEQMINNLDEADKFEDEYDKLLSGKEDVDKEYLKKKLNVFQEELKNNMK